MAELETAIVAVGEFVDVSQAEEWFDVVCNAYASADEDWATFRTQLTEGAAQAGFQSSAAETFIQVMENSVQDTWGVLRDMSERRPELPNRYAELLEELLAGAEGAGGNAEPWDPATAAQWYEYLTTGSGWGGWSGAEDEWSQFRDWFLQYAEPNGVTPQATRFLNDIEAHSGGKIAAFTEFGIVIQGAAQDADLGYDEATGLYYDESGNRYRRDSAGVDHPLVWTDSNLYWVSVDGEDFWYDQNLQPYGVPETPGELVDEVQSEEAEVEEASAEEGVQADAEEPETEAEAEEPGVEESVEAEAGIEENFEPSLFEEEDEEEQPEPDGDAVAEQVLSAVVGDAALELEEFGELSDEEFAELLSNVLEGELESHGTDTE